MRYPTLSLEEMTPKQRDVAAAIEQRGSAAVDGIYAAMLHSPEMADRVHRLGEFLRCGLRLPERLRILAALMALGRHRGADIVAYAHLESVRRSALSPEKIEALIRGRVPEGMSADEAAVHAFCCELLRTGRARNANYDALVGSLGREAALELVAVCGYAMLLGNIVNVTGAAVTGAGGLSVI